MEDISVKIKALQNKEKLTTKEFSKQIGVSPQAIYDYYSGKTQISVKILKTIADFFNVPISYFFEERENQEISKKIIQNGHVNNVGGQNNNYNANDAKLQACERENELLKQQIVDKEKIIKMLENKK